MFWMRGTPQHERTVIVSVKSYDESGIPNYSTTTGKCYNKNTWVLDNGISGQVTCWMEMPMPFIDQIYPSDNKVTVSKGNRRNLINYAVVGTCGLCEHDINLIDILYKDFSNLRSLCELKDEEFNNLTECLDKMKDIINNYIMDLYRAGGYNG